MIDPANVCLFIPDGLTAAKIDLFGRIAGSIEAAGGRAIRGDYAALAALPDHMIPITGASPRLRPIIESWRSRGRTWCYWDRGYLRRCAATWLPRGERGGYYRWHLNHFQMQSIRDVPRDRWSALVPGNRDDRSRLMVSPWRSRGRHIVIAQSSPTYVTSHGIEGWLAETVRQLRTVTDRKIVVRDKQTKRPLQDDLQGAHALVTHGSIAAVESVILGCPVFVHPDSAAVLVGQTDLRLIETPVYPDRERWLRSLAYCQFNERELVDGTVWRLIQ